MPALPPVPKVVRFDALQNDNFGNSVQNRVFFEYAGALSQADCDAWLATMTTAWHARIHPRQNGDANLIGGKLTDLSSASAPQSINSPGTTGTGAGAATPPALCIIVKQKLARRYRGGHPRHYMQQPIAADINVPVGVTAGGITGWAAAWGSFISDVLTGVPVAAAPAFEVSVSYFQGFTLFTPLSGRTRAIPKLRVGGPTIDLVTGHTVNPKFGSQRRRNSQ